MRKQSLHVMESWAGPCLIFISCLFCSSTSHYNLYLVTLILVLCISGLACKPTPCVDVEFLSQTKIAVSRVLVLNIQLNDYKFQ